MTCPGCEREGVALVGGYCGHCSSEIGASVSLALSDIGFLDAEVVDVFKHDDGYLHVRIDDGGEGAV